MTEKWETMGLLLRPDIYYTHSDDGLYLLTYQGPVLVGGGSAHPLLARLAPYLNGSYSLADLTANLSDQRRETVRQLISLLIAKGAITAYGQPPAEAGEQVGGYHREMTLLSHFTTSAVQNFEDYRDRTVAVIGSVDLVPAVAAAALRSGTAQVRLLTSGPDVGWEAQLTEAERGRRDPRQRITRTRLAVDADADAVAAALHGAALVLHVRDRPVVERVRLLERICADAGTDLFQALLVGESGWLLSAGPRAGSAARWPSVERRRRARHDAHQPIRPKPAGDAASVVAAAQLVSRAFRTVTAVAPPEPAGVTRLDRTTLASTEHAVLPHPFEVEAEAPTAATVRRRVAQRCAAAALDPETFSQRAARCMDDRLGVFGRPAEGDLGQLPLSVCEIEVSDPVGLLGRRSVPFRVFGTGLDFASARLVAGLNAFSAYGALMLDPRRLVDGDHQPIFARDGDPDAALRDDDLRSGYVHGYALTDGQIRLVPVTRAFPALDAADPPTSLPPGVASGYGWQEAVTAGILAQIRRWTLDEMVAAARPVSRLDLDAVALDPFGTRYRGILAALREEVLVYDITGTLSVPTVYCVVGDQARGCASGLTMAEAVRDALAEAVVAYQSSLHNQPAYAPPPIPAPPVPVPAQSPSATGAEPLHLDSVVAILRAHGREPVVVPLDHDPEVSAVMPNTVHVVVACV